ncbi:MAG TPA: tripartite tricarboxylate transporter substrate binding protein [Burkholderiales bacterium]|nr:tripartite tricarboxylate transporter substrate binding protein [Burkholderiales bacterium]
MLKQTIAAVLAAAVAPAVAQEFPVKPIRMIVPFAPGGPNDVLGRIVAQKLSEQIGQQVVVDNRSGAGGSTGTALAASAPPDGYTLLFSGTSSLAINPSLYAKLPYDASRDFAPVSLAGTAPSLLAVHPSVPARTVKELVAIAKASPGKLNYASGGVGGTPHLAGELFKSLGHVDVVHVPYRGAGPALVALASGQVDMYIGGISSVLTMVRDKRIRPIAVTSAKRTPLMPEMPTFIESGMPGYEVVNWYAVFAPAATPKAVVTKLNAETVKALASPDVKKRFADLGTDAASSTPDALAAYHREDLARWAKVIKAAKIQPE